MFNVHFEVFTAFIQSVNGELTKHEQGLRLETPVQLTQQHVLCSTKLKSTSIAGWTTMFRSPRTSPLHGEEVVMI